MARPAGKDGFLPSIFRMNPAFDEPEISNSPVVHVEGFEAAGQDFIVEVWIEKSTQNDWLVPLCQRRGVNLVVGIGEQSETRSRELALRSSEYGVPVRIIYISDFDPGGRIDAEGGCPEGRVHDRQIRPER